MSKEKTAIGSWLYLPLLIIPTLGFGLLNIPYDVVKAMGANAYLGIIVAAFMTLPGIVAIYLLAKRFPGQTIIEQGQCILGRLLGLVAGCIYLLYSLVMLSIFGRDIIDLSSTYFLDRTPVYIITAIFLLTIGYAALRGIETLARLASFILIPAVLVMIGLTAIGFQNFKWTHIMPVMSPNVVDYFKGGYSALFDYYILGISGISLAFLKPQKSFPRFTGGALLFLMLFFTVYTFGTIGVFGDRYLIRYSWPSIEFVHNIAYPYLLLEQGGLLMLIDWIAMILIGISYLYYAVALGSAQVSGLLDYKGWVWILLPLTYVMIVFPANAAQTKQILQLIIRFGWIILFAYPVLLWIIAVLTGRRE